MIAFIITLLAAAILLPSFNLLAGKTISNSIFEQMNFVGILFLASIGIGLLAGIYPALVLSSFKPITVLKGRFTTGTKGILLEKALVISQFTISIALIISTIIVYSTIEIYAQSGSWVFERSGRWSSIQTEILQKMHLYNAVQGMPNVKSVSMSSSVPGGGNMGAYSQIQNAKGRHADRQSRSVFC